MARDIRLFAAELEERYGGAILCLDSEAAFDEIQGLPGSDVQPVGAFGPRYRKARVNVGQVQIVAVQARWCTVDLHREIAADPGKFDRETFDPFTWEDHGGAERVSAHCRRCASTITRGAEPTAEVA